MESCRPKPAAFFIQSLQQVPMQDAAIQVDNIRHTSTQRMQKNIQPIGINLRNKNYEI